MYSLDFIDNIESVKEKTLEIKRNYILAEQKMTDMQPNMIGMLEQLEQINDRNSQEFKNKFEECEKAEREYSDILKVYEELEKKLESVKEYVRISLESNKEILENYKEKKNNTDEERIIQLLGDKTAEERILQCEKAIEWLENDYSPNKFEEIYTTFEKILGIQRQKTQVKFETKTHIYTYIDELGNEIEYNFFEKDNKLIDENLRSIIDILEEKGLTKKQIKKIDVYIASILKQNNLEMFNNYVEAIKNCEEIKFIISYDLRTDGIRKQGIITRKELNIIKKCAIRQKALGVATVVRDRSKFIAIMKFFKLYPIIGNQYKNAITEGNVQNGV